MIGGDTGDSNTLPKEPLVLQGDNEHGEMRVKVVFLGQYFWSHLVELNL